jgi:hypothetical protein
MALWPIFRVARSSRTDLSMLVARALKIGQIADGGMPPTYETMHQVLLMEPVSRQKARRGVAAPQKQPRALKQWLEIVILDVVRRELQRLAGNDLSGRIDLIFARPLSFLDRKGISGFALNFTFH